MRSRLHIPLQAPAVVGQKIDIPSTLIAFLHITDILVKALTLFFTEVSTILWKIVLMRLEEMHLTDMRAPSWRKFSINSSTTFQYREHPWLPRKFAMTDLRGNQAEGSTGFSASSKLVPLMSSLIWEPSNIPALIFSMLFCWNFWWRKANPLPSLSNAFTKFYMRLSLMWRGRSNILLGSTKGWYRTLCNRGFNPCLDGHTCLT